MSQDHFERMHNVDKFDWSNGATIDQPKDMIACLIEKLQQDMNNPILQGEVQGQLQALNSSQSKKEPCETSW